MSQYIWTPRNPLEPADIGLTAPIGTMKIYAGGIPGTPGATGATGATGPAGTDGADGVTGGVIPIDGVHYMVTPSLSASLTTMTPTTGLVYLMPFRLGADRELSAVYYCVITNGAGSTANIALYTDSGGLPGDLIVSFTDDSGTGISVPRGLFPGGTTNIAAGQIWVAYTSTGGTPPSLVSGNGDNPLVGNVGSVSFPVMNALRTAYTVTETPWDDPWTASFTSEVAAAPQIALQFT